MTQTPTIHDVIQARKRITGYVTRTPLHRYIALEKLLGASEVHVKHENHQRLGAFKMRGGINLLSQLSPMELSRGVSTASSGNHGQSIAYAASVFGAIAVVGVPEGANPGKVESMRNLGAEVIHHGAFYDETRAYMDRLSREEGYRYIDAVNESQLVAGVGTYTLEIMEDLPDVDVIIVPVGGGSGACGACIVAKSVNPNVQVIGVQAEQAPAVFLSWQEGKVVQAPMRSKAEGLATGTGFDLTLGILREHLDDFILVTDDEMDQAIVHHLRMTHNLTEHAGAASLAGAVKMKDRLEGKKVALIMSGGNVSLEHLKAALDKYG
ncbi:MAG: threonine/serine dehydratase [SAR202 cluster bacterium]|nr:threonine/serine dehydratase [SAR202 cluster bacterium]MDP6299963.1 threonine/serine dehydratase [SAR202 cluster bacterium]MDP7102774.1 threonine/serine dehydratase [SAR202 cluster bacterium]MDP7224255.1 threonine/serine dehydratase [SAR202 cluster bacterium]MDP7414713.1 threonine/serine dehydratase [SAR202 cluster bacterium]